FIETGRDGEGGAARHSDGNHDLHPAMIGIHLHAIDLPRPMGAGIERKNLRPRQYEIIVLLEESPHCLIPGRAHDRGVEYLERAQSQPALYFPLCFRFHQRAFCRICIKLLELAADLPGAQGLPVFPDAIDRVVRPRLLDRAAERLEHADRVLANIEHAWLETQISAETSCPGHA